MFRLAVNSSKRILTQRIPVVSSRGMSTAVSTTAGEASTTIPSVMDNVVTLNFVDPSGARRQVPGYIGKTLL